MFKRRTDGGCSKGRVRKGDGVMVMAIVLELGLFVQRNWVGNTRGYKGNGR